MATATQSIRPSHHQPQVLLLEPDHEGASMWAAGVLQAVDAFNQGLGRMFIDHIPRLDRRMAGDDGV